MVKSFCRFIRRWHRAHYRSRLRKARTAARIFRSELERDPLSHPHLRRMSRRELADLAFDPEKIAPD